jgi:hypothetical protein
VDAGPQIAITKARAVFKAEPSVATLARYTCTVASVQARDMGDLARWLRELDERVQVFEGLLEGAVDVSDELPRARCHEPQGRLQTRAGQRVPEAEGDRAGAGRQ